MRTLACMLPKKLYLIKQLFQKFVGSVVVTVRELKTTKTFVRSNCQISHNYEDWLISPNSEHFGPNNLQLSLTARLQEIISCKISQDKKGNLNKTLILFWKKPGGLKSFNQSATVFDTWLCKAVIEACMRLINAHTTCMVVISTQYISLKCFLLCYRHIAHVRGVTWFRTDANHLPYGHARQHSSSNLTGLVHNTGTHFSNWHLRVELSHEQTAHRVIL